MVLPMQLREWIVALFGMAIAVLGGGCDSPPPRGKWHAKFNWKAEDYFDDPNVVRLCRAIEAEDLLEMERAIKEGADVNAQGVGKMTPLLWAFPDNKLPRFECLLKHGANPNVIVESDFNTRKLAIRPGDSVTHMAAKSHFPGHFRAVMEHGGNPNLVNPKDGDSVLMELIQSRTTDTKDRIQLLIKHGADVNQKDNGGVAPIIRATSYFAQYDLAIFLLDNGADPNAYIERQNTKLAHHLLMQKDGLSRLTPQQQADYAELVRRLEKLGESFAEAQSDLDRWKKWVGPPEKVREWREAETEARHARQGK